MSHDARWSQLPAPVQRRAPKAAMAPKAPKAPEPGKAESGGGGISPGLPEAVAEVHEARVPGWVSLVVSLYHAEVLGGCRLMQAC